MLRHLTLFTLTLLLSACAVKIPEKATYTLTSSTQPTSSHLYNRQTVLVAMPNTNAGYETKHMVYTIKPYELSTFATHQWAGPPAKMLFPLIIQHIDNTGYLQAVAAPGLSAYQHKLLKTQLLEFHQDFTSHPSTIKMSIRADIIDKAKDKVVSTQVFSTYMSTSADTPYAGVIALNQATHILLDQIAWYCVQHLNARHEIVLPHPAGIKHTVQHDFNTGEPS